MKYVPNPDNLRHVPDRVRKILSLVDDSGILWKAAEQLSAEDWKTPDESIEFMMATGHFTKRKTPAAALAFRDAFWSAVIVGLSEKGSVSLASVYRRVGISFVRLHQLVSENRRFVVWLTRVPVDGSRIESLTGVLMERLAEVAQLAPTDDRGRMVRRNADRINRAGEVLAALRSAK